MSRWSCFPALVRSRRRFAACAALLVVGGIAVAGPIEPVFLATGGIRGESREIEIGVISASPDGRSWERIFEGGKVAGKFTHGRDNMVRALTYGDGKFVAAGNQGIGVMVSEDGREWRYANDAVGEGPGGFCIAFTEGRFLIPTASHFHVSSDGESWETHAMSGQLQERHGVGAWGREGAGHVRKVVGQNGVFVFAGERRFGATADGRTFLHHEVLPPGEKRGAYLLLAGAGRFLLLSEEGHRTSTDGVTWEPLVIGSDEPEVLEAQTQGVWTGEEFVVRGEGAVHRSEDGLEWESAGVEEGNAAITTAGNGILFGTVYRGFVLSENGGMTWTKIEQGAPARQVYFFDGERIVGSGGG